MKTTLQGLQALERGALEEAERIFSASLRQDPTDVESLRGLALICIKRNSVDFAVELLRSALAKQPKFIEARCDLARIFLSLAQHQDALEILNRDRVDISDTPDVWLLRGNALRALGRFVEALACYEQGDTPEHYVEFSVNRANVLTDLKRFEEAEKLLDAVVESNPKNTHALFNASLLHLRLGRWATGWPLQETRPSRKTIDRGWRLGELSQRVKKYIAGGTSPSVLLYSEQGLGDVLQYLRFLRHSSLEGCQLTVQVPAVLAAITQLNFPDVRVEKHLPASSEAFDICCSLMSLPAALGLQSETAVVTEPYLHASTARVDEVRAAVRGDQACLCVGIEWRGGSNPKLANRSMQLETFASLMALDVRFLALRQNPSPEECRWLDAHGVIQLDPYMMNFIDTAAVIQNLDAVVTIDTSIAHLAGAMGMRTLLLLPHSAAWVWMEERADSPWYSSMTLIRQPTPGDWGSCIAEAAQLL